MRFELSAADRLQLLHVLDAHHPVHAAQTETYHAPPSLSAPADPTWSAAAMVLDLRVPSPLDLGGQSLQLRVGWLLQRHFGHLHRLLMVRSHVRGERNVGLVVRRLVR